NNRNNEKKVNKKKMVKVLSAIGFLAILFSGTYLITDYISNPNKNESVEDGSEKVVVNQNPQELDNSMVVVLKTKNIVDSENKLEDLKNQLGISGAVTKNSLAKALESKGYKLGDDSEEKLVFNRENKNKLIPNKYYLGELDGMITIFKTNDSGEPIKVHGEDSPVNILPAVNQEEIRNFERSYDTEDEALIWLSAYTS
ncbi:MAG: hypothetical protein ACRC68_04775, partial [Clostridium sp.]